MKKLLFIAMALFVGISSAQVSKIFKHNGDVVNASIKKVEEFTIVFVYDGEAAEYTIGRYAVEKIVHASGREEHISDKIVVVDPKKDWEKVVILEDKSFVAGLNKVGNVRGKTGMINFQTGNTGDKKAEKKLKMEAVKLGCPFILMTSDRTTVGANSNALGGSQAIKKGVVYKY
jgi:hypothetical protein